MQELVTVQPLRGQLISEWGGGRWLQTGEMEPEDVGDPQKHLLERPAWAMTA